MYGVLLAIPTPHEAWCQRLIRAPEGYQVEVTGFVPWGAGRCTETVRIRGPSAMRAVDMIRTERGVGEVELLRSDPEDVEVRVSVNDCPVAKVVQTTGLAPQLPFRIEDGRDVWLVLGQRQQLADSMQRLREEGREAQVLRSGPWVPRDHGLTDHQMKVAEAAVAAGYYAYPRSITLTRLAERLGVAKSTLSETLAVVESKVFRRFLEEWAEGEAAPLSASPPQRRPPAGNTPAPRNH